MATISATKEYIANGLLISWGSMVSGDDGEWVEVYSWPTIHLQQGGTGTLSWQGTNDLSLSVVTGFVSTTDRPRYVRPLHSSGPSGAMEPRLFASRQN